MADINGGDQSRDYEGKFQNDYLDTCLIRLLTQQNNLTTIFKCIFIAKIANDVLYEDMYGAFTFLFLLILLRFGASPFIKYLIFY